MSIIAKKTVTLDPDVTGTGTNILINSSFESDHRFWSESSGRQSGYTIEHTTKGGRKCLHVKSTALNKEFAINQSVKSRLNPLWSTYYVVSYDVWTENIVKGTSNPFMASYFNGGTVNGTWYPTKVKAGSQEYIINNGKWERRSAVIQLWYRNQSDADNESSNNFSLYFRDFTGDIYIRNVKVEEGIRMTAWTASPWDAQFLIDYQQVGGRNLLNGSKLMINNCGNPSNLVPQDSSIYTGFKYVTMAKPTSGYIEVGNTNPVGLNWKPKKGEQFTLSFDVEPTSSSNSSTFASFLYDDGSNKRVINCSEASQIGTLAGDGRCNFTVSGKMQRVFVTWEYQSDATKIPRIIIGRKGSDFAGEGVHILRPKFEIGTVPTDWSEAPEDVAAYTDAKVQTEATRTDNLINNINIGGRNLLLNSDTGGVFYEPTGYLCARYQMSENIIAGQQYTLTVWYSNSGRNMLIPCLNGGNVWLGAPQSINNSSTKTVITFTGTANSAINPNEVRIYASNTGGTQGSASLNGSTFTITRIKLEKGNRSTDWSPAPEDSRLGGSNLLPKRYIVNRGCSLFQYDSASGIWNCKAPKGSTSWGHGFSIAAPTASYGQAPGAINYESDRVYVFSMEVKPAKACLWNFDVNNGIIGTSASGNDNDIVALRANSVQSLVANQWQRIWWRIKVGPNSLYEASSAWGIVTTDETADVEFKFRNVQIEEGSLPTAWKPHEDDLYLTGYRPENLLRNGTGLLGSNFWNVYGTSNMLSASGIPYSEIAGIDSFHAPSYKFTFTQDTASGSTESRIFQNVQTFTHQIGETYSLSFWAKASASDIKVVFTEGGQNPKEIALSTGWRYYTTTYKCIQNASFSIWLSKAGTIDIASIMLVKGFTPVPFTPHPLDDTQFSGSLSDDLHSFRTEYDADLNITRAAIEGMVRKEDFDEANNLLQSHSTLLTQNADGLAASVTRIEAVEGKATGTANELNEFTKRFEFNTNGMTISARGDSTDKVALNLDNYVVQFIPKGDYQHPMAIFTSTGLTVDQVSTSVGINMGNFGFVVGSDGNLSLKKVR